MKYSKLFLTFDDNENSIRDGKKIKLAPEIPNAVFIILNWYKVETPSNTSVLHLHITNDGKTLQEVKVTQPSYSQSSVVLPAEKNTDGDIYVKFDTPEPIAGSLEANETFNIDHLYIQLLDDNYAPLIFDKAHFSFSVVHNP